MLDKRVQILLFRVFFHHEMCFLQNFQIDTLIFLRCILNRFNPLFNSLFLCERVGSIIVSEEFQLSLFIRWLLFGNFIFFVKLFLDRLNDG